VTAIANPYETAIRITGDVSGFSSAMAIVTGLLGRTVTDVNRIQKGLASWAPAIVGATAGIAGMGLLKAVEGVERAGEKLVHAKAMFAAALPEYERAATLAKMATAALKESGENQRTVLSENISALQDLWTITQDPKHAEALLKPFNLLKTTLASLGDRVGGAGGDKEILSAVRAFDLAGRTTAETLKSVTEQFIKTTVGLHGRVTGEMLLTQIQTSGPMRLGMSDKVLAEQFPILMALGLGGRTGASSYQLFRLWQGGGGNLSSKQQLEAQEKYGLFTKEDELRINPMHHLRFGKHLGIGSIGSVGSSFRGFKAGTVFEQEKLFGPQSDWFQWAEDYRKKLTGMGYNIEDPNVMGRIVAEIGRGNKLLTSAFSELLMPGSVPGALGPHAQQLREQALIDKIDPHVAQFINENDPGAIRARAEAQWKNVKEAWGETIVPEYMAEIMKPLGGLLHSVVELIHENPTAVKNWTLAISGLGASLVGLGAATIIARFLPGGTFIVALGAFGAALAALGLISPNTAKTAMEAILKDTQYFIEGLKGTAKDVAAWIGSLGLGPAGKGPNPRLPFGMEGRAGPAVPKIYGPGEEPGETAPSESPLDFRRGLLGKEPYAERFKSRQHMLPPMEEYLKGLHPTSGSFADIGAASSPASSSSTMQFIHELASAIARAFGDYFGMKPGGGLGGIVGGIGGGGGGGGGGFGGYSGGTGRAHGQRALLGGGTPGGQPGGGEYNVAGAYDLIKKAGGTNEEARTLAAIAQAESSGNPRVHNLNARTGDNSYGLWQINMLGRMGPDRRAKFGLSSNEALFDPATNARVALAMSRAAHGYGDWSTFNHGKYRKYLSSGTPMGSGAGGEDAGAAGAFTAGTDQVNNALSAARSMIGQRSGAPALQKYFHEAGVGINSAVTAWCAAFANATLKHAGIPGTGSLAASSFASWGKNAAGEGYKAGDILGHSKGWHGHQWGHTMMATGRSLANGMVEVIAGDAGKKVSREWVNPAREQWHRRAPGDDASAGAPAASDRAVGAPPERKQHESRSHVYLDGRIVGELIEKHIVRRHAHTHGPSGHDGRRGLTPVDSWAVA
jgi:hypothetical protein